MDVRATTNKFLRKALEQEEDIDETEGLSESMASGLGLSASDSLDNTATSESPTAAVAANIKSKQLRNPRRWSMKMDVVSPLKGRHFKKKQAVLVETTVG